ncbi:MAG TPA: 5'-3' exonuclease H3TH domain-containing protein, partial [Ignavibacteriaceae bacterium]
MSKKFVIIDAMALAYKAYFVFINRPLVSSKGEPTSAVFGFLNQLLKILEDTRPDYLSVAFDSKEKTFRHEKYEGYKSSRASMPEDMIPQIGRIKEIIGAMNIPLYIMPGYEADDIIGTAVCEAEMKGLESFVITPDKDFNQLVTDNIKIVRPGKSTEEIVFYDVNKVKTEFGFEPKQMIDYLALIGDTSDDIPGIAGIGPKTAIPLIQQYGSVEEIYKHIDEIDKPALKKKLVEGKDNAFLSKELATIHCKVPIEFDFEQARLTEPDFDKLREIFLQVEFKNLYSRFLNFYEKNGSGKGKEITTSAPEANTFDEKKVTYRLITTAAEAKKLSEKLKKTDLFVFDTETDGLDHLLLKLAGVSFSTGENEAYYVAVNPFENDAVMPESVKDRLPLSDFIKIFKPVFENSRIKKVCQNGKFDMSVLRSRGIEVKNFYFDTMLASYVIDPDQKHGMDELSVKYLNYRPIPLSDLIGIKKDPAKIFDADLKAVSNYSCEDSDITFRLYHRLDPEIKKDKLTKV